MFESCGAALFLGLWVWSADEPSFMLGASNLDLIIRLFPAS
jgi:hypothetical protein